MKLAAHLAAQDDADAVVPETFGKTERIVGSGGARLACAVFHTHGDVECAQGARGNVLDFALQESVERIAGLKSASARGHHLVGHKHSGGKHGNGGFVALLGRHGDKLVLHAQVVGCFDGKGQSHV